MSEFVHARPAQKVNAAVFCAGAIALLAWAAFADHLRLNIERENGAVLAGLWRQLRFFTETTNIYVAALFSVMALRWPAGASRQVLGGLVLSVTLVALVYWGILYNPMQPRTPWNAAFNYLIHGGIPAAVAAYYIACAHRTPMSWPDCLQWAVYPLCYLIYALVRGQFDGRYPYFFLDPGKIGPGFVALSVGAITAAYIAAGAALIAHDHWHPTRPAS